MTHISKLKLLISKLKLLVYKQCTNEAHGVHKHFLVKIYSLATSLEIEFTS